MPVSLIVLFMVAFLVVFSVSIAWPILRHVIPFLAKAFVVFVIAGVLFGALVVGVRYASHQAQFHHVIGDEHSMAFSFPGHIVPPNIVAPNIVAPVPPVSPVHPAPPRRPEKPLFQHQITLSGEDSSERLAQTVTQLIETAEGSDTLQSLPGLLPKIATVFDALRQSIQTNVSGQNRLNDTTVHVRVTQQLAGDRAANSEPTRVREVHRTTEADEQSQWTNGRNDWTNEDELLTEMLPQGEEQGEQEASELRIGSADPHPSNPRPAWVERADRRLGKTRQVVVSSGPWDSIEACEEALSSRLATVLLKVVQEEYGDELTLLESQGEVGQIDLETLGITPSFIRRELCHPQYHWVETRNSSVGEMKEVYVMLELGVTQRRELMSRVRSSYRERQVQRVGLGGTGLVLAMGLLWMALQRAVTLHEPNPSVSEARHESVA